MTMKLAFIDSLLSTRR